jgi:alkylation response protein AidB-like acyl-CoA dehydrogenase
MPIGITDDHETLRRSARRWLDDRCAPSVPRALLESDDEPLPAFWPELADMGWLGLHVSEDYGGGGATLLELAVVLEEAGRHLLPGPFLGTVTAAAVIAACDNEQARKALLPMLTAGTPASVTFGAGLTGERRGGDLVVSGRLPLVLSGAHAEVLVTRVTVGDDLVWVALDRADVTTAPVPSLDQTRRLHSIEVTAATVLPERQLTGVDIHDVGHYAALLAAAEATGIAGWCLDTAVDYAKTREQFGRPIGQFQAIKHRCADLLIAVEQTRSAVWDAVAGRTDSESWPLAVATAVALALETAFVAAKDLVQILGGIGFTWEHDAHLYLKRAMALRAQFRAPGIWRLAAAKQALAGVRRTMDLELEGVDEVRAEIRAEAERLKAIKREDRRAELAKGGWIAPHWPKPYGRDASAVEQVVIDQELRRAKVGVPHLQVGGWALPTIIAHGTADQQERWIWPTLRGEMVWCQLFSEPGAGSDLAALSTKAVKVEGGWRVTGQKVWTSMAQFADWGILIARTDPDAPKHEGITYFLLDMKSDGIDIRPLRELTGHAMFNEVFLTDVFVPDDCVVGEVNDGWRLARTTLANERVSMGSGSSFGVGLESVLGLAQEAGVADDLHVLDQLGGLLIEAQSLAVLGFRTTLRALSGAEPGSESSVRKLLGVEHEQRVQEMGVTLLGPFGATTDGEAAKWTTGFLANRCLTIAGGTSEVQRNVIAERLLGLPRDP